MKGVSDLVTYFLKVRDGSQTNIPNKREQEMKDNEADRQIPILSC